MRAIFFPLAISFLILFNSLTSAQPMPVGPDYRDAAKREMPIQPKAKPTIAVTTFENLSAFPENTWVAMSFSEALTVKLKRLYERFRVVERLRVYEVIKEQGFDPEKVDRLEVATQREMGSLIGANFLILGSVSLQGLADEPKTKLLANMRTVDVQTGKIKEATSVSGQMQEIFDLEIQLAFAFLKQVGVDLTQAEEQQISIKETSSLLAEKYYNLGNQYFYDGNLEAAEAWYKKAVDLTEGGYHREAALRWVEVLKGQKARASTEAEAQLVHEKAGQRIETIRKRRAETDEMYFEEAELHTLREEYAQAIEAYQLYLDRARPWRQVKWRANVDAPSGGEVVVGEKIVYIYTAFTWSDQKSERSIYRLFALTKENGTLKWKFEVSDKVELISTDYAVVSSGDIVYYQTPDVLYALDSETGSEKWKFEAPQSKFRKPNPHVISLQVANGSVYFRTRYGILYALEGNTGQLRWQFDPASHQKGLGSLLLNLLGNTPDFPDPVIADGMVITFTQYGSNSRLAALNAKTGEILWTTEIPSIIAGSLIVASGTVYIPANDGVVAVATETGRVKWQSDTKAQKPLTYKGDLIFALASYWEHWKSEDGRSIGRNMVYDLLALSAATGKVRWKKRLGKGEPGTVIAANGVLLYQMKENLHALSAETGETQWQFEGVSYQPIVVQNNIAYFISKNRFNALELSTGKILWQFTILGEFRHYGVATDGTAYISTDHEGVFALNPKPKAYRSRPEEVDALVGLGRAKRLMGKYDDAVESLQAALKSWAYFTSAYQELALCYEGMGNWGKATRTWDEFLTASVKQNLVTSKETSRHLWEFVGVRWHAPGMTPYLVRNEVAVIDDTVYLPASDGYVYALNSTTGQVKWRFEGKSLTPSREQIIIISGGDVSLSQSDTLLDDEGGGEAIYALDASTGAVQWKRIIPSGFQKTVIPDEEVVYLLLQWDEESLWTGSETTKQKLYALSMQTGELLWKFAPPRQGRRRWSSMIDRIGAHMRHSYLNVRDQVYWSAGARYLYALSKGTGSLKWRFDRGELLPDESHWDRLSAPIVTEAMIYVTMTDALAAINTETGKIGWKVPIPGLRRDSPIAVDSETVYVSSDKAVYALAGDTSEIQWQGEGWGSTLFVDRRTVYSHVGRRLLALAADTGEQKWEFVAQGRSFFFKPVLTDHEIYFPAEDGLYAVNRETGELKWKFGTADEMHALIMGDGMLYASTNQVFYAFDFAKISQLLAEGKRWWESGDEWEGAGRMISP